MVYNFSATDSPTITQGPKSTTVSENSSVTFKCVADANPPAEFHWLLGDQKLPSNFTGVTVSGGHVMITPVSTVHAGKITCVAINIEGTTSSVATLTVLSK